MNGAGVRQRRVRSMAQALSRISLAAITLLVAGCGSLFASRGVAPVTYVLRPSFDSAQFAISAAVSPKAGQPIVRVESAAAPGYATDAILATLPDRRLDIFAASRWPDVLPRVIENLAVQALRTAGIAAHEVAAPVASTHSLRITARRFDAEYRDSATPPMVRIILDVVVLRGADRQVVGQFTVEAEAPAAANRMAPIVTAFEAAAKQALSAVATRVAEAVARDVTARTPDRHPPATISA